MCSPWWFVYQPVSYRLISRHGTLEQLRSMIKTCRTNGVRVYADAVVNHMVRPQSPSRFLLLMIFSSLGEETTYKTTAAGEQHLHAAGTVPKTERPEARTLRIHRRISIIPRLGCVRRWSIRLCRIARQISIVTGR